MRRNVLLALLLVGWLLAGLLPAPVRAEEPFFDPARFRLNNGLEVWVQSRPETPAVALRLMARVGSRYETTENNGISHFLEHMLFTGTEQWDEAEVAAVIDRLGGYSNGWTSYDATCYWTDVRRDYLPQAMEWLAQLVVHPTLAADQMDEERQVILQEMGGELGLVYHLMEQLGFGYDLGRAISAALFPDSMLVQPIIGDQASLESVDHAQLLEHYRTYYTPDNMLLVVVGDVTPDEVRDLAEIYLGQMSPGGGPSARPGAPAPFSGPASIRLRGPNINDWGTLSIGYRTVGAGHPDRYALQVAAEVLGFRLDESVRYERGLVYSIGTWNNNYSDAGYFGVWTSSEGKNVAEIQPLIEAEMERLREEAISSDDLARAQTGINGRSALWLETNGAQADYLADVATWLPSGRPVPDDFAGIDAVTAADVQRVAQTYFVPERRYTALYRPALTLTGATIGGGAFAAVVVLLLLYRRWRRRAAMQST
jgi:predicted Zn-dependent peptidase